MLIQILKHTPLWVWGIFALLLVMGYSRTKSGTASKKRLAILPGIFILLSILGVVSTYGASTFALASWATGAGLGLLLNRLLLLPRGVSYDLASKTFAVPGSYVPMILMMAIFATKYVVGVTTAINHDLTQTTEFMVVVSMAYGFFSGSFLARSLHILSAERNPATNAPPAASSLPLAG